MKVRKVSDSCFHVCGFGWLVKVEFENNIWYSTNVRFKEKKNAIKHAIGFIISNK